MRAIIALIIFTVNSIAHAGGFYTHIRDAIQLNKKRTQFYSTLTNGKSKIISKGLITLEYATIPISKYYDFIARKYNQAGIPLLELDFIDMKYAPEFSEEKRFPERMYSSIRRPEISLITKELKRALKADDYEQIIQISSQEISALEENRSYNCLTRHFLESVRRSAALLPYYIKASKQKGLSSPQRIVKQVIKLQLNSLILVHQLDIKAAPIQQQGVAIICQDIPHIPMPSEQQIEQLIGLK